MAERRVALVTGGAKRVGRAIVERLARGGVDVAFTYHRSRPEELDWAHEVKAVPIPADLTDLPRAIDLLVQAVNSAFGRLDILVNSASIYHPKPLGEITVDDIRLMSRIHVEAPLMLTQAFAPMLRAGRGHVVNMVDLLAERPWPKYLAYCASKAALWNLTLGLARELAPEVTVNAIAPGVVEWPEDYPQAEREKYLKRVPLARAGTPQDAAELVHFLCTSGTYITGQVIRLDGGRSIT